MTKFSLRNWSIWAEWRGGASYAEIAQETGLRYAHVYSIVQIMRRILRYPPRAALMRPPE